MIVGILIEQLLPLSKLFTEQKGVVVVVKRINEISPLGVSTEK
jgi:hypothetical protein